MNFKDPAPNKIWRSWAMHINVRSPILINRWHKEISDQQGKSHTMTFFSKLHTLTFLRTSIGFFLASELQGRHIEWTNTHDPKYNLFKEMIIHYPWWVHIHTERLSIHIVVNLENAKVSTSKRKIRPSSVQFAYTTASSKLLLCRAQRCK